MRILIVEDERKIANALKRALAQESYAVDVCYDSDEGLSMATTEPYDIAVIDRMLPGSTSGLGIVRAMRRQKIHTPVLLLTALGDTKDRVDGLDAGADDYLVKPFALEELLARIRALGRRPSERESNILEVETLTLDTNTKKVIRNGKNVKLTQKEFALLEYLMRNEGRPLPKENIIAHVWDYDADVLHNTVEVYVKYLRNKIDTKPNKPLIHTVRGFGYKLESLEDEE